MVGVESEKPSEQRGQKCLTGTKIHDETHLALLLRYLDICNQVLAANCHRFPYRQIWSAGEDARSGKPVVLLLAGDEVKAACIASLGQAEITVEPLELARLEKMNGAMPRYPIDMAYVLQVLAAPDLYIADPSRVNWDWLQP